MRKPFLFLAMLALRPRQLNEAGCLNYCAINHPVKHCQKKSASC